MGLLLLLLRLRLLLLLLLLQPIVVRPVLLLVFPKSFCSPAFLPHTQFGCPTHGFLPPWTGTPWLESLQNARFLVQHRDGFMAAPSTAPAVQRFSNAAPSGEGSSGSHGSHRVPSSRKVRSPTRLNSPSQVTQVTVQGRDGFMAPGGAVQRFSSAPGSSGVWPQMEELDVRSACTSRSHQQACFQVWKEDLVVQSAMSRCAKSGRFRPE